VANAVVEQLTNIGASAVVQLDGSGSFDADDPLTSLSYQWRVDGGLVCDGSNAACGNIQMTLAFGVHDIALRVTDPKGEFDEVTVTVTLDPARLAVLEIDKAEVEFDHNPPKLELKGEIGLPFGVNFSEVAPVATASTDLGGTPILSSVALALTVEGEHADQWKFRDPAGPITKFDIDWQGARYRFREEGFPVQLKSQLITGAETILSVKYKMDDVGAAFSIDIDGQATVNVDATGAVTASVPVEVEKPGRKVTLRLPFALLDTSVITFSGALSRTVAVADGLKSSVGRFRMEATFDPALFPGGAATTPLDLDLALTIGAQAYPGTTSLDASDLKVEAEQWKEKRDD